MMYICWVLTLIGAYFGLQYFIKLIKEADSIMKIRLRMIEAKKLYEKQYGFKSRTAEISLENKESLLSLIQFKGRL